MEGEFEYAPLGDALRILASELGQRSKVETVGVREGYRRVLAKDVVAKQDSPMRDATHFDGYAVSSEDLLGATADSPKALRLRRGTARPGQLLVARLGRGEAMEVLTGGYLPSGADAVVPLEEASMKRGKLLVKRPVEKGGHVYPAGADVKRGERVLERGRTLMGQDLVLLASLRFESVVAFKRPRVAILPTGSELTARIGDELRGKVVESHSLLLDKLVGEAGGEPATFPIVPDDERALSRALARALKESEVVFTLAGSSVGGPDLVDSTIRGFGKATTALVHGLRVNRGRVMGFAVVRGKPVVILPGPIQGALNAFIVLGYPLVRYHLGMGWEEPPVVAATMGADWDATGKFKDFDQIVYLRLTRDPGSPDGLLATPSTGDTEKVSFLVSKNAYTFVSGENPHLTKGARIQARLLPGFSRLE